MARKWTDVLKDDRFKQLSMEDKQKAQDQYFNTQVTNKKEYKQLSDEDKLLAKEQFYNIPLNIEQQPEAIKDTNIFKEVSKGVIRGGENLLAGLGATVTWIGKELAEGETVFQKLTPAEKPKFLKTIYTKTGDWIADKGKVAYDYYINRTIEGFEAPDPELFKGTFVQNPSFTRGATIIAEAIPSLAGATAITLATKNPIAGAVSLGLTESSPDYINARQAGKSHDQASAIAGIETIGTTMLESLPLGKLLKEGGKVVPRVIKGALREGTQEATQQAFQNLVAKIGFDKTRNLTEGIIESLIAGAGSGGLIGGVVAGRPQETESIIQEAKQKGVKEEELGIIQEEIGQQILENKEQVNKLIEEKREKPQLIDDKIDETPEVADINEKGEIKETTKETKENYTQEELEAQTEQTIPLPTEKQVAFEKFYMNTVNRFAPIENMTQRAKDAGVEIEAGENPSILARAYLGSAESTRTILEKNTFTIDDKGEITITGEGLKPILQDFQTAIETETNIDVQEKDLIDYLESRRIVEDLQREVEIAGKKKTIATEKQIEDATVKMKELESKYKGEIEKFDATAQRLYGFQKRVLKNLVDSGNMSESTYNTILKQNPNYIPFQRVMEDNGFAGVTPVVKKRFTGVRDKIRRIVGSERDIENPFESIIKNTYQIMDVAGRNKVARSVANMRGVFPEEISEVFMPMKPITLSEAEAGISKDAEISINIINKLQNQIDKIYDKENLSDTDLKEVENLQGLRDKENNKLSQTLSAEDKKVIFRPSQFVPKGNVIEYFEDGKRKFVEVSSNLYQAMSGLNEPSLGIVARILSVPANMLRVGATITPEFFFRNLIRDQYTAKMQTNFGFKPFVDTVGAMSDILNKREIYYDWLRSGGSYAGIVELSRPNLKKAYNKLLEPKYKKVLRGLNIINTAQEISQFFERATRVAAFKSAKNSDMADIEAGFESRESTLDFARRGAKTKNLGAVVPFLNAGVQAFDKSVRSAKADPIGFTMKGLALITVPSLLLYLKNKDDEDYKEIPRWQKDLFWVTKVGETYVRIPKPFGYGQIFGTLPERFLEYVNERDPKAFDGLIKTLYDSFSPISGDPVTGLLPTAIKPLIENATNWNFFLERNIVPKSKERLITELQYGKYTSETAKQLSRVSMPFIGKTAPAKIDNLVRGYFGGTGGYALQLSDKLIETVKRSKDEPIEPKRPLEFADYPLLKGFVTRSVTGKQAESYQQFYNNKNEIDKAYNSYLKLVKEGQVEKADQIFKDNPKLMLSNTLGRYSKALGSYDEMVDQIVKLNISTQQKKKDIIKLERERLNLVKEANNLIKEYGEESNV